MTIAVVAILGFGVAALTWWIVRRLADLDVRLRDVRVLRRETEAMRAELERALAVTRTHLAAVVAGSPPPADVVRRGAAFRGIEPAEALALRERLPDLCVLDVRTPAEFATGHIPNAVSIPLDELEDRLGELPAREAPLLVTCAAGGRATQACQTLAARGWTNLLNLSGGMHAWTGSTVADPAVTAPAPAGTVTGTAVSWHGGDVSESQVLGALRECYDPEIPLNIFDLGLIYDVDIAPGKIAVRMTLTSEACPSARAIPADVRQRIAALGEPNVEVDVVFDPPWHPSRISPAGRQKLGIV
jgi:metal-sulfur cluster biosynthetic enzyme/rhodanese-related sulfurtransferase